jgi:hypothetical protein
MRALGDNQHWDNRRWDNQNRDEQHRAKWDLTTAIRIDDERADFHVMGRYS